MGEVERRASEAKGPSFQREEGWELGEKESKRVEIHPTHRSGMGLKVKIQQRVTKVLPFDKLRDRVLFGQ